MIGFVSGPARGCQLSPGRGARAWEALAAGIRGVGHGARGHSACLGPTPLSSSAQKFFGGFQPRGGDIWKISGQPAKLRGRRSGEMGFSGSALEAKGGKKTIETRAGRQVSDVSHRLGPFSV